MNRYLNSQLSDALTSAHQTRGLRLGEGCLGETGQLFAELFPDASALIIADENTYAQAGEAVQASLASAGVRLARAAHIFPGRPQLHASYDHVEAIRELARPFADAVICSIGAGTINDLTKLASGELGRPYLHVCTAASGDGYAAFGAAITRAGFKITRVCPAPAGVVADVEVIRRAPKRLAATGYGDLLEKIPAGADWLLAAALGVEPVNDAAWELVQAPVTRVLADPDAIAWGDAAAIGRLMAGLLASGLAMQLLQSSRPASGAGHQFAAMWEMEGHGLDWEPPLSHGFKVGIGAVASLALWEAFLDLEVSEFQASRAVAVAQTPEEITRQVRSLLEPRVCDEALAHALAKHLVGQPLSYRIERLSAVWPTLRSRLRAQLIPAEQAMDWLRRAGAPHHPELIGIDQQRLRETYTKARLIRQRYTVLDVVHELGLFDELVAGLFAPSGFWGRHPRP